MDILKDYTQSEFTVKGSRFLSELFPCETQADARNLIKSQKTKYADSTHVVHAFVIGLGGEILGMSDDGEPSGTAGRPALDVLKGYGCTNVLLTITRWFGGTLLGTGGLVKAYGDGAKQVLAVATEAGLFVPYTEKKDFTFTCDYGTYQPVKRFMETLEISDLNEQFAADITVNGKIPVSQFEIFAAKLKDLSNGRILL